MYHHDCDLHDGHSSQYEVNDEMSTHLIITPNTAVNVQTIDGTKTAISFALNKVVQT